uniref:Uncharacterized protein n=1 Tax=Arundo donax TaxID=35708 RepID=A0A0A9T3M1_ARUDO
MVVRKLWLVVSRHNLSYFICLE